MGWRGQRGEGQRPRARESRGRSREAWFPESSLHCGFPLTALPRTCSSQFWAHTVVWSTVSPHPRREGVWGCRPGIWV